MHYSCHLAPWGYQSHDQSEYMHWNGNFAALLFINHWEYTQNTTFAKQFTYPLLEGLNAWWGCFLTKTSKAGGGYSYNDISAKDPGEEHEGQKVPNPQIALALIKRSLSAQLDIAKAIGATPEPIVADMLANLAPFNVGKYDPPSPSPSPPAPHFDCSTCAGASEKFEPLPGEACSPDYSDNSMGSCSSDHKNPECCAAMCANDSTCQAFTFCAGPGTNCPHTACWLYRDGEHGKDFSCSARTGNFSSGRRKKESLLALSGGGSVYTAYENATVQQSDGFAYYPLWPSEMVNALDASADMTEIARRSVALYVAKGGIGKRPVLEYSAAVRAGAPAQIPKGCIDNCTVPNMASAPGIIADFEQFLKGSQRGSCLPEAPGGGTENVGIVQAVNDMLVQAPNGRYISLFPVWDRTQDASFENLLVKGAVEVSASWSAAKQEATEISIRARKEHKGLVALQLDCADVAVDCADGSSPMVRSSGDLVTFNAPPGVACKVVSNVRGA
jgi:hypothetical protein